MTKNEKIEQVINLLANSHFDEANELKRELLPTGNKLYRYYSVDTALQLVRLIKCIEKGEVYLNLVERFNDPFDTTSIINRNELNKLPQGEISNIDSLFWGSNPFESRPFEDKFEKTLMEFNMHHDHERLNDEINSILHDYTKITCFTERNTNMTMWAHYANDHKGVCLEYDFTNFSDSQERALFPVSYVASLPFVLNSLYETIEKNKVDSTKKLTMQSFLVPCLLRKLKEWSYEDEWRIALMNQDSHEAPIKTGKYTKCGNPTKIFFGVNTHSEIKTALYDLFNKEIEICEMTKTRYGLKDEPYVRH